MKFLNLITSVSILFGATAAFAADQDCSKDLTKTCAMVYSRDSLGERSMKGQFAITHIRFAGSDVWYFVTANDAYYTYSFAVINDNTGEVTLKSKTSNETLSLGQVETSGLRQYAYVEVQLNTDLTYNDEVQPSEGWTNCIGTALGIGKKEFTKSELHHLFITSSAVQNPVKFFGEKVLSKKSSLCFP